MTMQRNPLTGKLLKLASGSEQPIKQCCCVEEGEDGGGEEELCEGEADCTGHTGNAGVAPSIALTVFDADYAGGNITWCAKVWTQQEVKDGVTKCVCPTRYDLKKELTQTTPVTSVFGANIEKWEFSQINGLWIDRAINLSVYSVASYYVRHKWWRILQGAAPNTTDRLSRTLLTYDFTWTTGWTSIGSAAEFTLPGMNPATSGQIPTINDYKILDAMFGNYTDVNGINWKWERGRNWG